MAKALLDIDAVGFTPHAPTTFKSGIVSPVYVDNRRLIYHPPQWHVVIESFASAARALQFDVIAGVAVGGVPHSSALAYMLERPSVFVRKAAKGHGTARRIEGGDVTGQRVLLVEDLVTTGGSSLDGVAALREAGAVVEDVLALVSYGFAEAREAFTAAGVRLHTLTDFDVLVGEAGARDRFDEDARALIADWLHDPHGWSERHGHA